MGLRQAHATEGELRELLKSHRAAAAVNAHNIAALRASNEAFENDKVELEAEVEGKAAEVVAMSTRLDLLLSTQQSLATENEELTAVSVTLQQEHDAELGCVRSAALETEERLRHEILRRRELETQLRQAQEVINACHQWAEKLRSNCRTVDDPRVGSVSSPRS